MSRALVPGKRYVGVGTATAGTTLAERLRTAATAYDRAKAGPPPFETALLLDCSGSMAAPLEGGPTRIAALARLADDLAGFRRFVFSSTCLELLPDQPLPLRAGGGTNMAYAFSYMDSGGVDHVVLITDGEPDCENLALDAALAARQRVDVLYVGDDPAPPFLKRLADATKGTYGRETLGTKALCSAVRGLLPQPKETIQL